MKLKQLLCGSLICIFSSCHDGPVRLPYYVSEDFTPQWISAKQAASLHSIPDFAFTDQDGKQVTLKTFDGKITVVDFFFTTCPGICKHLTASLLKIQETFKNDNDVLLLSHTVTPEKDNVA